MKEYYGTPIADDADTQPRKPYQKESQIVTDGNRKRRFHGAFTGGFSAGYWNTVGSAEGWEPRQFKSSRLSRADPKEYSLQDPKQFMDSEDLTQFGIAPQKINTRNEFNTEAKQKSLMEIVFQPSKNRLAMETLRYLKWSDAKTVGNLKISPTSLKYNNFSYNDAVFDGVYQQYNDPRTKKNGLGYKTQNSIGATTMMSKPTSKFIRGQAFGIGVFEEEEETDIYGETDMSAYNFFLESEASSNLNKSNRQIKQSELLEGFSKAPTTLNSVSQRKTKVILPDRFQPTVFGPLTKKTVNKTQVFESKKQEVKPVIVQNNVASFAKKPSPEVIKPVPIQNNKVLDSSVPDSSVQDSTVKDKSAAELAVLIFEKRFVVSAKEPSSSSLDPAKSNKQKAAPRRFVIDWFPSPELCKNFNVNMATKRRSEQKKNENLFKNLVFESSADSSLKSDLPVKSFSNFLLKNETEKPVKENESSVDDSVKQSYRLMSSAMMQPISLKKKSRLSNLFDDFFKVKEEDEKCDTTPQNETKLKHVFTAAKARNLITPTSSTETEESVKPVPQSSNIAIDLTVPETSYVDKSSTRTIQLGSFKTVIEEEWVDKTSILFKKEQKKKKKSKKLKKSSHKKKKKRKD